MTDPVFPVPPAPVALVTGGRGIGRAIAALTAFLLSDAAAFITGQNYVIAGGMTRKMIYLEA